MKEKTTVIKKFADKATKDIIDVKASTKETLKARADILCKIYNAEVHDGNFAPYVEIKTDKGLEPVLVRDYMVETVNEYTAVARLECFNALKATSDPMLEAVRQYEFETIYIADKKEGEQNAKIPVTHIEYTTKPIDLEKLGKHCGGIGKDKNWMHYIAQFNALVTAAAGGKLGYKPEEIYDSFYMREIARKIKLGEIPTSDEAVLNLMNQVITAMIGNEYKAEITLSNYLIMGHTKAGKKKLTIACAKPAMMVNLMSNICHSVVTGNKPELLYKMMNK